MKSTILTLSSCLALAGFAFADCKDGSCSKEKAPSCKDGDCDKGAKACKIEEGATFFSVSGMTCSACSDKVTKALGSVEGVAVQQVCFKSGSVVVKIDPAKATKDQVTKAITDTGFKVDGESVNLNVTGMTCSACSDKLTKELAATEGVTVKKVCHKSGNVCVVVDGEKANEEKVKATVAKAGFQVK